MTKYGKNVTTLNNIKKLVKILLILADGENPVPNYGLQVNFEKDDEVSVSGDKDKLQVIVSLKWVKENKLQVSGKVRQKPHNKLVPKGVKKSDLLTLLECSGENLELPPPKAEEKKPPEQERKEQAVQGVLECLHDLDILDAKDSNKNQGYWIFSLTLEHETKQIAEYIENKFKAKFPLANIDPVQPITKSGDREKPGVFFFIFGDLGKSGFTSITDADLSELSSIIQDKTVEDMVKEAYQYSLPPDADLWVEGKTDLNQMLSQLDRFGKVGDFLLHLSQNENFPAEYRNNLNKLTEQLEGKKYEVKTQYPGAKYLDSYLMIKIEAQNRQPQECPKEFLVNGWLLMDDSSGKPDISQFKPILHGNETAAGIICQEKQLDEVFN